MAGKYIEFVNPGYSTLYTRDLKYSVCNSTRDSADPANPFDPDSANPLLEGEFLQVAGTTVTRGSEATPEAAVAGGNVEGKPCWLHFSERGRYDAQITKKAHLVTGPVGFEFKSKLGNFTSASEGDRVFVADFESPSAAGKFVRGLFVVGQLQGTVSLSSDGTTNYFLAWSPGYITRAVSSSEAHIQWDPQYIVLNKA